MITKNDIAWPITFIANGETQLASNLTADQIDLVTKLIEVIGKETINVR